MSNLLKRVLKISILPAALIIVAKVIGLYIAIKYFHLEVFIDNNPENMFSIQLFFMDSTSTLLANSVSNFAVLVTLAAVNTYLIFKYRLAIVYNNNPKTIVKLTKLNLISWVNKKDNDFMKVFVWTVFLWMVCFIIMSDVFAQGTYQWIGIFAFVVCTISTWVLIRTFEIESQIIYPDQPNKLY